MDNLEAKCLSMEVEYDVAGFLVFLIERWVDGTILTTQTGLTHRIVTALDIDHLPPKRTPSTVLIRKRMDRK
jgi:hypothetical protein